MSKIKITAVIFSTALISCSNMGDEIPDRTVFATSEITKENVSYENFIKNILSKECATCHGSGGSAEGWWLNKGTYQNAFEYSRLIEATILNKTMPPPPKFPLKDSDRELVKAWLERGAPE